MKSVIFIAICFLMLACGSNKIAATASDDKSFNNKNVLPPNTASNKYSQMRESH